MLRSQSKPFQAYGKKLITAPLSEPVTADQLRSHLRATSDEIGDSEANLLVTEARQLLEDKYNIAMITQTWEMSLDHWPCQNEKWWDGTMQGHRDMIYSDARYSSIPLPMFPLQSITSVTVYDEDGNDTAVTVDDTFDVDTYQTPGRITLKNGSVWPVALRSNNAIIIRYVAGYGDAASNVPSPIVRAVKNLAGYLYNNRGDCDGGSEIAASGAGEIINSYRAIKV